MDTVTQPANEEIDLRAIISAIVRQWPWIALSSLAGLVSAWISIRISKPVWQGEFQVVVSSKQTSAGSGMGSFAGANHILSSLGGINFNQDEELQTEVKILESPSVLKPIYEQVKSRKAFAGENVADWDFDDWAGNFEIKLEKGTSILKVAYRDSDKSLILPVLNQVSKAYQNYSEKSRNEALLNGSVYLGKQVERMRNQAASSSRSLDSFRLRYGIASNSSGIASSGGLDLSSILNQEANNTLFSSIGFDGSSSSSAGMSTVGGDPLAQLASINQELIRRRKQFTERDPSIQSLLRERDSLRLYIESSALGTLALPGRKPRGIAETQSIVLRYRELDRAAKRDASTLNSLETSLLNLQLEKARNGKPWQLISTPTLQDLPISPRPIRTLGLGLLAGLVLGSGVGLLADRRSGRVFDTEELTEYFQTKFLARLQLDNPEHFRTNLALISQGLLADCQNLGLIPVGLSANDSSLDHIRETLHQLLPAASIQLVTNLSDASACSHQLLVTSLGAPTRRQLQDLQQQLQLQTQSPCGWLLLDHNNAS